MTNDKPAKVDWDFARGLYLRGHGRKSICEQTGATDSALDRQITRGGWRTLRDRLPAEKIAASTARGIIQDALSADLVRTCETLPQIPQSIIPEKALVRAQLVEKIAGASAQVLGQPEKRFAICISTLQAAADSAKPINHNFINVASEPLPDQP